MCTEQLRLYFALYDGLVSLAAVSVDKLLGPANLNAAGMQPQINHTKLVSQLVSHKNAHIGF